MKLLFRFKKLLDDCDTQEWFCQIEPGVFYAIQLTDFSDLELGYAYAVEVYSFDLRDISRKQWKRMWQQDYGWEPGNPENRGKLYQLSREQRAAHAFDAGFGKKNDNLRWGSTGNSQWELFKRAVLWCQPTPGEYRFNPELQKRWALANPVAYAAA